MKQYQIISSVFITALLVAGCTSASPLDSPSINEDYYGTWTAAEDKTTEAGYEVSLTIASEQLIFISANTLNGDTTFVTMNYKILDEQDNIYHLTLTDPVGRIVTNQESDEVPSEEQKSTVADNLWEQYKDMYLDTSEKYVVLMYSSGYQDDAIELFNK